MDAPEQRLESIMQKLKVSRQSLAQSLGISLSSVAMYFTSHHRVRRVVALAVQAVYGVNADWIMTGRKPIFVRQNKKDGLSTEGLTLAKQYDTLPKDLQSTAREVLAGLLKLRDGRAA
jgi:transcriptional regulator with XRE-family HTH domain